MAAVTSCANALYIIPRRAGVAMAFVALVPLLCHDGNKTNPSKVEFTYAKLLL